MSDPSDPPATRHVAVTGVETLTPAMRRVTLGGEGLRGFALAPGAWGPTSSC